MRPWTLPILAAVALSLAAPSTADARLRFGPGAVLGAVAGVMFGGFRHAGRHHRHSAMHASMSHRGAGRWARHPAPTTAQRPASAPQATTNVPQSQSPAPAERPRASAAALFWPEAAADLADYLLFANGNDRFWTYGYDTIIDTAFAGPRSEEHTSELQSRQYLVCRLLLEKKKKTKRAQYRSHVVIGLMNKKKTSNNEN